MTHGGEEGIHVTHMRLVGCGKHAPSHPHPRASCSPSLSPPPRACRHRRPVSLTSFSFTARPTLSRGHAPHLTPAADAGKLPYLGAFGTARRTYPHRQTAHAMHPVACAGPSVCPSAAAIWLLQTCLSPVRHLSVTRPSSVCHPSVIRLSPVCLQAKGLLLRLTALVGQQPAQHAAGPGKEGAPQGPAPTRCVALCGRRMQIGLMQ